MVSPLDPTPGLTLHNSLDAMVTSYERTRALITKGFAAIEAARAEFNAHFALGGGIADKLDVHGSSYHYSRIDPTPDHALKELKRKAWEVIVERLELRRVMSISAWEELSKAIADGTDLPEITHENVMAFGRDNVNPRALERMMTAAIAEVFEWLRPHNSRYKRNSEYEIPERLALTCVVDHGYGSNSFRVEWRQHRDPQQHLIALENVLRYLDGRGQIARSHKSDLQQAIEKVRPGELGSTEFFEFRCYKNLSLHLRWKRPDLLRLLNQRAGGMRVRPGEASGGDMVPA